MEMFEKSNYTQHDWQIKIVNSEQPSEYSVSSPFTIIYPKISVEDTKDWMIDTPALIRWNCSGCEIISSLSISLVNEQEKLEIPLQKNFVKEEKNDHGGDGDEMYEYEWKEVDALWLSNHPYFIRICWDLSGICGFTSSFHVIAPKFEIATPNSVIITGSHFNISWSSSELQTEEDVYINTPERGAYRICNNSVKKWCSIYPVPFWFISSPDYSISVCWSKRPFICNKSQNFSVEAVIHIQTVPNQMAWHQIYSVKWNTTLPLSSFSLSLYKISNISSPSSSEDLHVLDLFNTSTVSTKNTTYEYEWMLPSSIPAMADSVYFFRVSCVLQQNVIYGVSNLFKVVPHVDYFEQDYMTEEEMWVLSFNSFCITMLVAVTVLCIVKAAAYLSSHLNTVSASRHELCVICWDRKKEVMIDPCGHICLCRGCAKKVTLCPACRVEISSRRKVFV
eukprot:TRINITY_DN8459_c0_g1_i1.p1 TRINITY_DN8459_c0_g1~~TRINITY_DN8459_c0_g1_i1.p1  ORF type:complete len:449 (-),score=75.02 TRINITY_DN8459_c0_g1_i1:4-1350(-)